MNGSTNIQVVGISTGITTITVWLLSYYAPGLMLAAPDGVEAMLTGFVSIVIGLLFKGDAGIKSLPGTGASK